MSSIVFDTLKTAKRLKKAGFTEEQAEELVDIYEEIVEGNLATKTDLKELELRMIVKLGTIMVIGIGVIATLVKVL